MSATTTAAPGQGQHNESRSELRARRLRGYAVLGVGAAVAAVWSLFVPWVTMSLGASGTAVTVTDQNWTQVRGVVARASLTGWGITHQPVPAALPTMGSGVVPVATPAVLAGLPAPVTYLLLAALAGVAAVVARLTVMAAASVYLAWHASGALDALYSVMFPHTTAGMLNSPAVGFTIARFAVWALLFGMALAGLQTFLVNRAARAERNEALLAAGQPLPATLLDRVEAIAMSGAGRLVKAGLDQVEHENKMG